MLNSTALTIGTTSVRHVGELYSLNDLHRESGGELRHRPIEFVRLEQTQGLIGELAKGGDSHLYLNTVKGRNGGTYGCKELVIAYAAWISAAFHLKVIRVFLNAVMPVAAQRNPAIDYDRISPAQAQDLKEIVEAVVKAGVQGFGETWGRLHRKFKVNSYLELPATRHLEVREYLIAKLPKGDGSGVLEDEEVVEVQLPNSDLLKSAFALATHVATEAARTTFAAMLEGKGAIMDDRWMFSMARSRDGNIEPWAAPIQPNAMVVSMGELPKRLTDPNGMITSDADLANLASACTKLLAERAAYRATKQVAH